MLWKSYHTAEVGDSGILVGVWVKEHLSISVDGNVCFYLFPVLAQKLGNGLDFRFGLGERAAVGVVTRVRGGTFIWGSEEGAAVKSK